MNKDLQDRITPNVNDEMPDIDTQTNAMPAKSTRFIVPVVVAMCVVWVGLCFVFAREFGWALGKTYLVLLAAHGIVNIVCIVLWNPVLIKRRTISPIEKIWDFAIVLAFGVAVISMIVVANRELNALEVNPVPFELRWLFGLCLFVGGWAIVTWSMVANPFFEKHVRIQSNHGHHVIDRGPYAYVRHPGYVGFNALLIATPLMLASEWTFLPSVIAVTLLVIRTVFEDRMLRAELHGYQDYADRVRFRLVPGLW